MFICKLSIYVCSYLRNRPTTKVISVTTCINRHNSYEPELITSVRKAMFLVVLIGLSVCVSVCLSDYLNVRKKDLHDQMYNSDQGAII